MAWVYPSRKFSSTAFVCLFSHPSSSSTFLLQLGIVINAAAIPHSLQKRGGRKRSEGCANGLEEKQRHTRHCSAAFLTHRAREGRKGGEEPPQPGSHHKYCRQQHQIGSELSSFPHLPAEDEGIRIQESCLLGSMARLLLSDYMQFRHTQADNNCWRRGEGRQRQTERQKVRERWGRGR